MSAYRRHPPPEDTAASDRLPERAAHRPRGRRDGRLGPVLIVGLFLIAGTGSIALGLLPQGTAPPRGGPSGGPGPSGAVAGSSPALAPPVPASPVPTNATTVAVGSFPVADLYDPSNGDVYVTGDGDSGNLTILNGTQVVGYLALGHHLAAYPSQLLYDPSDELVYATTMGLYSYGGAPYGGELAVINGTSILATIPVGADPAVLVFDAADGAVDVVNELTANVSVIIGTQLVATLAVGSYPMAAAYDPSDGYVYVANYHSDNLTVLNGTSPARFYNGSAWGDSIALGGLAPYGVTYDGANGLLYVGGGNGTLSLVNGTRIVAHLWTSPWGFVAAWSGTWQANSSRPDYGMLYIANYWDANMSMYNGTALVASTNVGKGPEAAIDDAADGFVFVADNGSNELTVLSGLTVVASVPVGVSPDGIAIDTGTGCLYVTDYGNATTPGTVTILCAGSFPSWPTYPVDVAETGLPAGSPWDFTLAGIARSSTSTNISVAEPNGTYAFGVSGPAGYAATPSSGTVVVSGTGVRVAVAFNATVARVLTYAVDFTESGLPSATNWSVDLNGSVRVTTATTIAINVSNGTYSWLASAMVNGSGLNVSGNLSVAGAAAEVNVTFLLPSPPLVPLTFRASGLGDGTTWSLTLTATASGLVVELLASLTRSSAGGATLLFDVTDGGTYDYTATAAGYHPATGTVAVSGDRPQNTTLVFVPEGPAPPSGPPPHSGSPVAAIGVGIGLLLVAVLGLGGLAVRARRQREARREEGRELVARLGGSDWELGDEAGADPRR